ncbi:tRNA (adenosine(37)-N6)-threonylcarbamoyltransferase complex ATPase subunit type 1 TsaE [Streptococcus sciuri]|uniref:tRNA threonylcarbamoyladenosine biosynthesis protein TsaE n=1 Tax=Streptococcus sciuri TaxID=2973939 RepID=A0ABT2F8L0_9STRE|nr:tRNA (adenosine(37)-N6)-threonylcarbamoyltransferase complex ATPase subunit type 1 TsaE [Streptococcus sciuri]MCS4488175.1 tRNA (adenosine(37)-N6)-threonylcarbamoyltransferase complex ATPase subunit type 1 TsaE [Streptococcus sciuri]
MLYSHNETELKAYGEQLAKSLQSGDIIVLTGDLGVGKTTLTKGLARGLGITQMVKSPTYTIVRQYEGRLPLYHLDVYRIGSDSDSIDLDAFLYSDGVSVIEWGELLDDATLGDYLEIILERKEDGRTLRFKAHGKRAQAIIEDINRKKLKK